MPLSGQGWRERRKRLVTLPPQHELHPKDITLRNVDQWLFPITRRQSPPQNRTKGWAEGRQHGAEGPSQKQKSRQQASPSDSIRARNLPAISVPPFLHLMGSRSRLLSSPSPPVHLRLLQHLSAPAGATALPSPTRPAHCNRAIFLKRVAELATNMLKALRWLSSPERC